MKKDEIKEWLDYFKKYATISEKVILEDIEDYITNLQEEIKSANESATWWTNRYGAVVRNCDETVKKMMALGEENERLNKECDTYMKIASNKQKRIDKAIKFNKKILKENWYGGYEKENATKNINILQGKDNE